MRAVTVRAGRPIWAAFGQQLSMHALLKLFDGIGVANRAIDLGGYGGARSRQGRVTTGMALHAGGSRVARPGKFLLVHKHGAPAAGGFQLRVAMAALAVAVGHPLRIKDLPDLVRLVAVHAGGDQARSLLPQLAADEFAVHRLNQCMALRAGPSDVLFGNRRPGVGVGQNEVRRMATGTNRRDDQATAEQALAVHTFGIVFQDLVLRDVVSKLDGRAFMVTAAAQEGDLGDRGGRRGIGRPQDVVSSVTIRATRGQRVSAPRRLSVQAFRILLCFIGMARAAVNRLELFWVGKFFPALQISVAIGALKCRVRRGPQGSRVEGGRHSRLPLACAGSGFVASQARLASRQGLGLLGT